MKEVSLIWIAKVVLLLFQKRQADWSEKEYDLLHYMDRMRPLDGIYKELGRVFHRWGTTDEMDHSMRDNHNKEVSLGEWFELEPWSTIRKVVHIARSDYSVKHFGNASAWPNHFYYLNRVNKFKQLPERRLESEAVKLKDSDYVKDPDLNCFFYSK